MSLRRRFFIPLNSSIFVPLLKIYPLKLPFYKYHGAGNDFIIIDNRQQEYALTETQIASLCHRRTGIGADGLMLLEEVDGYDFSMVYYNADGAESTMCGNGGRCITLFAHHLGLIQDEVHFIAIDGPHHASVLNENTIALGMIPVTYIEFQDGRTIMNTGSPHVVIPVEDLPAYEVFIEGRKVRKEAAFAPKGINVNFVQTINNTIHIRTYERGVEDETLACGTGVTAAAIASVEEQLGKFEVALKAVGGDLSVSFEKETPISATNIVLTGPAVKVFEGIIHL